MNSENLSYSTVVIGAGQAGLAAGYYLKKHGEDFIILDANQRIGDSWRQRWDSLRLFTPTRFDALPGMPFTKGTEPYPTKDEMADYLEAYAARFDLPVRMGVRVERLTRQDGKFLIETGSLRIQADNVIVAMSNMQKPKVPPFARELNPGINQLHSSDYCSPSQLKDGDTLLVGAGNSGAEIAMDIAPGRQVWLSGRDTGSLPFDIRKTPVRRFIVPIVLGLLFHRVLTVKTPMGRKNRAMHLSHGGALIRQKPAELAAAGIKRLPRVAGVRDGKPVLEDGRVLDVSNVIWCTGFHPGFSWIDLPVIGETGPLHYRGVVDSQPGLYFVGLGFLYSFSSSMIHGVGRDAAYIVNEIRKRQRVLLKARGGSFLRTRSSRPALAPPEGSAQRQ